MSGIEAAVYAGLSTHSGLSALVGTRIYPVTIPQGVTFPCVTYCRVSGVRERDIQDESIANQARMQFDCWAQDTEAESGFGIARDVATQLTDAVVKVADGNGVVIQCAAVESDRDDFDITTGIYRRSVDALYVYTGAGV